MHILKPTARAWKGPGQLLAVRRDSSAINLLTATWKLISRNTTDHRAILAAVFAEPFVVNNPVSPGQSDWTSKWRARSAGKGGNTTVPMVSSSISHSRVHWPLNSQSKYSSWKSRTGCTHSLACLKSFWKISSEIFPICQFRMGLPVLCQQIMIVCMQETNPFGNLGLNARLPWEMQLMGFKLQDKNQDYICIYIYIYRHVCIYQCVPGKMHQVIFKRNTNRWQRNRNK